MRRDAEKEKFWRAAISEAGDSGQCVRAFCRGRGLDENRFYFWRRELRTRDAEAGDRPGFVELVRAADPAVGGAGVSIRMGDRISVVLDRGFDASALKSVLSALNEVVEV